MKGICNIEEYCKDGENTLSMQGVEVNDYNRDYVILVAKETGAWATINKSFIYLVEELLEKEITFNKFKEAFPEHMQLLNLLFSSGILKVNHVSSFHDKLIKRQCKISDSKVCQVVLRYTKVVICHVLIVMLIQI